MYQIEIILEDGTRHKIETASEETAVFVVKLAFQAEGLLELRTETPPGQRGAKIEELLGLAGVAGA